MTRTQTISLEEAKSTAGEVLMVSVGADTMLVSLVLEDDARWKELQPLNYNSLAKFALVTCRQLLDFSSKGLESLEIGVRLDIGVSPDGVKPQFWVDEVTSWPSANYFSCYAVEALFDDICRAYADAFAAVFPQETKQYPEPEENYVCDTSSSG